MPTKSCEVCCEPITKRNADKFCSRRCYGIGASRAAAAKRQLYACVVCGIQVDRKPRHEGAGVVCSSRCLRARRRQTGLRLAAEGKVPRIAPTAEARAASSARMSGAGCPKFNGYRTTGGNGRYILIRAPEGWPWPTMIGARGYIREHRKVVAETLGRALCREEVVHHMNGDTRDNSPSNLSLKPCNRDHMAEHIAAGLFDRRWPACIFGCGRQAKPHHGRHFQACARCRRIDAHRTDPRSTATF